MDPTHQLSVYSHPSGPTTAQGAILDPKDPSSVYSAQNAASTTFTFGPGNLFRGVCADLTVSSSDQTVYCVHRQHLSGVSSNAFAGLLLNAPFSISVVEPAAVFNIVLHILYGRSFTHHNPSLDTIEAALDALVKYGVNPDRYASSSQPLYRLLLLQAPHHPIEAYALAARHGLEDVAVAISAHLLTYDLSLLTDALSIKMGAMYLRRLIDLHFDRTNALKSIVVRPPGGHPPTSMCTQMSQARLTSAWMFAIMELAWDRLPGISTDTLHSVLETAGKEIACRDCCAVLQARVREVCREWSQVKGTI